MCRGQPEAPGDFRPREGKRKDVAVGKIFRRRGADLGSIKKKRGASEEQEKEKGSGPVKARQCGAVKEKGNCEA